jgi:hypothetical protein
MLKSVLLPAPLGPITLCKIPVRTSRFTFAATTSVVDVLRHAVLQHRLLAADLLQSQLPALVV